MSQASQGPQTPKGSSLLFGATLISAVFLMSMVVASPFMLSTGENSPDALLLFARDMTVRRTAFFCSVGLTATAFIFFRPVPSANKKKDGSAK